MSIAAGLLDAVSGPQAQSWQRRRLRDIVILVNGYPFISDSFSRTKGFPLVRIRDLFTTEYETYVPEPVPPQVVLRDGDIVVGMDGDFAVALWRRGPAALNQRLCLLRPRENVDMRFIAYWLPSALKVINDLTFSTTVKHLSSSDLLNERIALPPIEEQRRIADFLDAETARLARLGERYQTLRSLLTERWQALVRQHIAGVDAPTSQGDAHISWLGQVDPRWPITTIGRISRTYMGTTFPHAYQGESAGDIPFIKVGDFGSADSKGWLPTAENWITRSVAKTLGARAVPAGTVIYARVGAALLLNQRRITTRDSIIDDNVRGLKFTAGDPRYWRYLLTLLDLGKISNPGPVPSVSETQVAAVSVPLPPTREQLRIADRLDKLNDDHSELGEKLSNQLALLNERRQALITAAVTGQIDVTTARGLD